MELAGSELGRLVAATRTGSTWWRRWGKVRFRKQAWLWVGIGRGEEFN